jgi:hypothetical protein
MKNRNKTERITINDDFYVIATNNFNGKVYITFLTLYDNGFLLFQVRMYTKVFQNSDKFEIAKTMLDDYKNR